jgi:hypothetical protein
MTAAEAYEAITGGGTSDLADAVQVLDLFRPWCLIGGLAVNCYVEPVYPLDADVVIAVDRLAEIEPELIGRGFHIRRFAHSLNASRAKGRLNLQISVDPRYQDFLRNAAPADVLGLRVPVASLPDLVRGKVWAYEHAQPPLSKRKKDELDLIRIAEAHSEMRVLIPQSITSQFQEQ